MWCCNSGMRHVSKRKKRKKVTMKYPQWLLLGGVVGRVLFCEPCYASDADARIKALEQRVAELERLLMSSGKLSAAQVEDAEPVKKLDQKVRTLERRMEVERENAAAAKQT